MKTCFKRMVSLLCILAMLCAVLPVMASADSANQYFSKEITSKSTKQYVDLKAIIVEKIGVSIDPAVFEVTIDTQIPEEGGVRVSDNGIAIFPAQYAGCACFRLVEQKTNGAGDVYEIEITVNPTTPRILSAVSNKNGVVELKWSKVKNADYYCVAYSKDPNVFTNAFITKDASTTTVVKDLELATTYYFKVQACAAREITKGGQKAEFWGSNSKVASVTVYPEVLVKEFGIKMNGRYGNQDGRTITVKKGTVVQMKATGFKPAKAIIKTVKWESSDSKVAYVNWNGKITTLKRGSVLITATARDGGGAYCSITLIVK